MLAGATLDETARDGSPYKLRFVAHDRQAYDWYYNVVSNPMLWFVQHSLWELPYAPKIARPSFSALAETTASSCAARMARRRLTGSS